MSSSRMDGAAAATTTPLSSSLIGQEEVLHILGQVLPDPPHLFLSGAYGCGKTTLLNEFLAAYFKQHGIEKPNHEEILWLSSEQDRGIHCVRQSVAEFVRHTSARPGVYRWIVIDDADSLPMISQQALRRPMETHAHTTRFLFCSRHSSDLIQPIKSRCLHLELDTVSPMTLLSHFCKQQGAEHIEFAHNAIAMFMSLAQTPTELYNVMRVFARVLTAADRPAGQPVQPSEVLALFAAPSFSLCLKLLRAYIQKRREELVSLFVQLWATGISYEDFLHELTASVHQLGILPPAVSQSVHQLILKGWIQFAQGKTHSLDLMRLFFEDGRLNDVAA